MAASAAVRATRSDLRLRFYRKDDAIEAQFTPDERYEGYVHMIHGGVVATMLDEAMSWAVIDRGHLAVTAKMEVQLSPAGAGWRAVDGHWSRCSVTAGAQSRRAARFAIAPEKCWRPQAGSSCACHPSSSVPGKRPTSDNRANNGARTLSAVTLMGSLRQRVSTYVTDQRQPNPFTVWIVLPTSCADRYP